MVNNYLEAIKIEIADAPPSAVENVHLGANNFLENFTKQQVISFLVDGSILSLTDDKFSINLNDSNHAEAKATIELCKNIETELKNKLSSNSNNIQEIMNTISLVGVRVRSFRLALEKEVKKYKENHILEVVEACSIYAKEVGLPLNADILAMIQLEVANGFKGKTKTEAINLAKIEILEKVKLLIDGLRAKLLNNFSCQIDMAKEFELYFFQVLDLNFNYSLERNTINIINIKN